MAAESALCSGCHVNGNPGIGVQNGVLIGSTGEHIDLLEMELLFGSPYFMRF